MFLERRHSGIFGKNTKLKTQYCKLFADFHFEEFFAEISLERGKKFVLEEIFF